MPGPGYTGSSLLHSTSNGAKKVCSAVGLNLATGADWLVVLVLHFVCPWIENNVKPHHQDLDPYLKDPAYQFPHVAEQHVPADLLFDLTYYLPLAIIIVVTCARERLVGAHYGLLSYLAGYHFTWLSTEFIKLQVGRLRPDFFSRCAMDAVSGRCTGAKWLVQDGRKSFPSGHSSGAFFMGIWLLLFLAGQNGAFQLNNGRARLFPLSVAWAPVFLSFFIAISRWQDHIHHPTDILAGSILGILHALLFYIVFWPAPWFQGSDKPRVKRVSSGVQEGYGATDVENGERQPLLGSS